MSYLPKIAVIDDQPEFLEFFRLYFSDDYAITGFTDYQKALEQIRKGEFDAVVLDILMPGKSGLDVLEEIKKTSNTPVIMITASKRRENIIAALRLGADDYVEKPFDFGDVRKRIDETLKRKSIALPQEPPDELILAPADSLPTGDLDSRVKSVLSIVAEEYDSPVTLFQLGKVVNLAPYYLGRLIKKETGVSFKEILARYRLKKSADLLLSSQHRIKEVARLCGFNNFHYFCRLFNRFYGMPPSLYRKANK
jgi:YesN/AraC family two-component response regulator